MEQNTYYLEKWKVSHWLNGYEVVTFEMQNDIWDTMVANSKFKDMSGFGKSKTGHIVLQDHGDQVWFKNIKIRVKIGTKNNFFIIPL